MKLSLRFIITGVLIELISRFFVWLIELEPINSEISLILAGFITLFSHIEANETD